jgi:hypothetical protein
VSANAHQQEGHAASNQATEYTVSAPRGRVRSGHGGIETDLRRRLRPLFFGLASLWGFLVGGGGLAFDLYMDGHPVGMMGARSMLRLTVCLGLAVGGGLVLAGAYRELRKRLRG